jgi:hypothetical protein
MVGMMAHGMQRNADTQEDQTMKHIGAVVIAVLVVAGLSLGTALGATPHKGKAVWHGTHTMTGTVTEVDHTTGMLSLNTQEGELKLHFPPAALADVKNGDTLTVSLGFHAGTSRPGMSTMQH